MATRASSLIHKYEDVEYVDSIISAWTGRAKVRGMHPHQLRGFLFFFFLYLLLLVGLMLLAPPWMVFLVSWAPLACSLLWRWFSSLFRKV